MNELSQLLPDALFSPEDSRTFTYKGGWEQWKREHDEKIGPSEKFRGWGKPIQSAKYRNYTIES